VVDDSPADQAGLLVGDALIEGEGRRLGHPTDLLDALTGVRAGGLVTLTFLRGGAVKSVSVAPADRGGSE